MPTIHRQIMTALVERIATIDGSGDYQTSIGLNVLHWDLQRGSDDDDPTLEIKDVRLRRNLGETIGQAVTTIEVEVIPLSNGQDTYGNLCDILGDLVLCLQDWDADGLAEGSVEASIADIDFEMRQTERRSGGCPFLLEIQYSSARNRL